uniref:Protein kinase domain-containing protein n=1 Tax=Echeneis naucrates TaxID=173247 RepID=A0A665TKV6_ECHNA
LELNTSSYKVLDFNGEGCFGKVAKCRNLITKELVAVKIHKETEEGAVEWEVEMLETVGALDPDKSNIVKFLDHFTWNASSCLAFEMLDISLWDLLWKRQEPLTLNEIRPITQQLLVAFEALKRIGIMHTDLKPDNIMLVNHSQQPFKIKVIDFGLALPSSEVEVGTEMQAPSFRAPEVTLGLPLSEAVDMWAVGCVLGFLYFATNLFPGVCPYNRIKSMVHLVVPYGYFDSVENLEDAIMTYPPKTDDVEDKDRREFFDLLSCSLKHNFVTMAHLRDNLAASSYTEDALQLMSVSLLEKSEEPGDDKIHEDNSHPAVITDVHDDPSWHYGNWQLPLPSLSPLKKKNTK